MPALHYYTLCNAVVVQTVFALRDPIFQTVFDSVLRMEDDYVPVWTCGHHCLSSTTQHRVTNDLLLVYCPINLSR